MLFILLLSFMAVEASKQKTTLPCADYSNFCKKNRNSRLARLWCYECNSDYHCVHSFDCPKKGALIVEQENDISLCPLDLMGTEMVGTASLLELDASRWVRHGILATLSFGAAFALSLR